MTKPTVLQGSLLTGGHALVCAQPPDNPNKPLQGPCRARETTRSSIRLAAICPLDRALRPAGRGRRSFKY